MRIIFDVAIHYPTYFCGILIRLNVVEIAFDRFNAVREIVVYL